MFHLQMPFQTDRIVVHIHGGGFIAMNSASHQTYTRKWARFLGDVPIFSIDYRKAPQHPFPAALDDCFSVYMWIVENASENFYTESIIIFFYSLEKFA
jgi:hormone-sensitive lipase